MTILVTGVAGFIGFQLARKLLQKGKDVIGLDNVNAYYDVSLKEARLRELEKVQGFRFMRLDLGEGNNIVGLFAAAKFDVVITLAAQDGRALFPCESTRVRPQQYRGICQCS